MTRAPALVLALAVAAVALPVAAHGPLKKTLRTAPPDGSVAPPSPPLAPAQLEAAAIPTTSGGARPLRTIAADAAVVALVSTLGTEQLDGDRLLVHRLRVERVLRGDLDATEIGLIELRGASRRPPLLAEGQRAIVLLAPRPRLTYLDQHVPPAGTYFAAAAGHEGVLPVRNRAEIDAIADALGRGAAIAAESDADAARAARRRLAFFELGSGSPRLATDALAELRALDELDRLSAEESAAIARTLTDTDVPPATRAGLMRLLGERRPTGALAALAGAATDTPVLLEALLEARTRLDAPPTPRVLRRHLASKDPAVRAAAVHALGATSDPAVVTTLEQRAVSDDDQSVRAAAIEALGMVGRAEAIPVLSQTFSTDERELRQKSGQAILRIGGPAAADALVDLALHGDSSDTQAYAALLLIATRGPDDPAVRRIAEGEPGPAVRQLLEHGLEFHEQNP
jgi:HEAT repeat protein